MNRNHSQNDGKDEEAPTHVTLLQIVGSIGASFFGVQNSKNRKRDFASGKAGQFIAVGIVMTAVWYFSIYLVVNVVLDSAR